MADPRIETVAAVLRDNGHNATGTGADTDTLAKMIVDALDGTTAAGDELPDDAHDEGDQAISDSTSGANPETPVGTGVEGGSGSPAA